MKRVHYYCDHCGKDCGNVFFEIWRNKYNGLDYSPVGKSDYCESCYEKLTDYREIDGSYIRKDNRTGGIK